MFADKACSRLARTAHEAKSVPVAYPGQRRDHHQRCSDEGDPGRSDAGILPMWIFRRWLPTVGAEREQSGFDQGANKAHRPGVFSFGVWFVWNTPPPVEPVPNGSRASNVCAAR